MSVNQQKVNQTLQKTIQNVANVNSAISRYAEQLKAEKDQAAQQPSQKPGSKPAGQ